MSQYHRQFDIICKHTLYVEKNHKSLIFVCFFIYCSTRWHSNEFIKGAYSFITTKCDASGCTRDVLNEALYPRDFLKELPYTNDNGRELIEINERGVIDVQTCDDKQDINASPVMLFAGEACNSSSWATAHGAFLSGIEQAEKISRYY